METYGFTAANVAEKALQVKEAVAAAAGSDGPEARVSGRSRRAARAWRAR